TGQVIDIHTEQEGLIEKTSIAFQDMLQGVQKVRRQMETLNKAAGEMEDQNVQIVERIQNISAVSEQTAASCEEAAASTSTQNDMIASFSEQIKMMEEEIQALKRNVS